MEQAKALVADQLARLQIVEQLLLKAWTLLVKSSLGGAFLGGLTRVEHVEMLQRAMEWRDGGAGNPKSGGLRDPSLARSFGCSSAEPSSRGPNCAEECEDHTGHLTHVAKVATPLAPSTVTQSASSCISSPVLSSRDCAEFPLPGDTPPRAPAAYSTNTSPEDLALPLKKRGGGAAGNPTSECSQLTTSPAGVSRSRENHPPHLPTVQTIASPSTAFVEGSEVQCSTCLRGPATIQSDPRDVSVIREKEPPSTVMVMSDTSASTVDGTISCSSPSAGTVRNGGQVDVSVIREKRPPSTEPITSTSTAPEVDSTVSPLEETKRHGLQLDESRIKVERPSEPRLTSSDTTPPKEMTIDSLSQPERGTVSSPQDHALAMKEKCPTALPTVSPTPPKKGNILHGSLVDTSSLLICDDLDNFNVVQEETVGLLEEMDADNDISEGGTIIIPYAVRDKTRRSSSCVQSRTSSKPAHGTAQASDNLCGECGKVFANRRNLRHHVKVIHESEQTYSCEVCSRVFRHPHNLTIHKQNKNHFAAGQEHLVKPVRSHKCSLCNRTFLAKSNLDAHFRLHTGARPFKCSHCNRRFTQSSNCKKHELTHTHQRPFSCDKCHQTFTSSCNMQRHRVAIHGEGKGYLCTLCGKTFTQRWNLKKHERGHT